MIDKDIEYLKEVVSLAKTLPLGEVKVLEEESQAIENVLAELEKYKKAYELETYERQKFIEELETWKKIAEKLAEELAGNNDYMQNIIDWARKEVK